MTQDRWRVVRYCLWAIIVTTLPPHVQPWPPTNAAFAAEAARAPSNIVVVNPNNPVSATSFVWGGTNWRFESGTNDGFGDWHLTRSGVGTGYLFQVVIKGANLYGYNLDTTTWYRWSGSSWSQVGSSPPFVSGTAVPFLLGANCCSKTSDTPWTAWLGRIPDYDDNGSGFGVDAYWIPGQNLGGAQLPGDISYAMAGWNSTTCFDPNGQPYSDLSTMLQGIAAGNYDSTINSQIQKYLVPITAQLYFIRISHEWNGNWYCDSPWYKREERASGVVSPSVWIAAWRHIHDLLKAQLPNARLEWDGPTDATQAAYYPGDNYVDLIGNDAYVGKGVTNDSGAAVAWRNRMNGSDGWNFSYLITFQQQHNKPLVFPEWSDQSQYSSTLPTGNPIITQFANLFASLSLGPGKAGLVAQAYWDNDMGTTCCGLGDFAGKKTAYRQPWPNGFANTHYKGAYWKTPLMPSANFWR